MKRKKSPADRALHQIATKRACEWDYPRIGLYVPTSHHVPAQAFQNFMAIAASTGLTPLPMARSIQLDMVRTRACESLMRADHLTHLLMLDEDHTHPTDIVQRLARWPAATRGTENEVEVVAGLNFSRGHHHKPCCYVDAGGRWDGTSPDHLGAPSQWEADGLMNVAIAGTGSMLIAKTALAKLDRPYFFMPQIWNDADATSAWPGEDIGFAINCRKNGVRQFVDVGCTSPHLTTRLIDAADYDREGLAAHHAEILRNGQTSQNRS